MNVLFRLNQHQQHTAFRFQLEGSRCFQFGNRYILEVGKLEGPAERRFREAMLVRLALYRLVHCIPGFRQSFISQSVLTQSKSQVPYLSGGDSTVSWANHFILQTQMECVLMVSSSCKRLCKGFISCVTMSSAPI